MSESQEKPNPEAEEQKTFWQKYLFDPVKAVWNFFIRLIQVAWGFLVDLIVALFQSLRAVLMMIIKTPYYLLPSAAHSTIADEQYNDRMKVDLAEVVHTLDLDECHFQVIKNNWLDQLNWTSNRALRERNANELMRWWQIVLGVAIPVISGLADNLVLGIDKNHLITVIGIFLAVVTGVYQFRRPEERWRHYRIVHEKYLNELWEYVALSGAYAPGENETTTHRDEFQQFNERMIKIRREDLTQFFGQVFPASQRQQQPPPDENNIAG